MFGIKLKQNKSLMIIEVILLSLLLLVLCSRSAFSEIIPGNYTVGDERHKVTMSRTISNYNSTYSKFNNQNYMSKIYVNYVDSDGNSFDFSQLAENIEYDCSGNVCNIEYNEDTVNMFGETLGYISINHGNGSNLVSDVVIPKSFTYESTFYSLDYYYASYGCDYSYYYGRIYDVELNDESIDYNRYVLNPLTQYYTDKITVDETDDILEFFWEYYTNKITVNINDNTGENVLINDELGSMYFYSYDHYYGYYSKYVYNSLTSSSILFEVPSNYIIQGRFYFDYNNFMISLTDKQNISFDNINPFRATAYGNNYFTFYPSESENVSLTFSVDNMPRPIYLYNKTASDVGGDTEFEYTITLSEKINGHYFGIDYVDGVGKFYLKAGYSKDIYLPKFNLDYIITLNERDGYEPMEKEISGTISADTTTYIDTHFRYSPENEIYYYGTVVDLEDLVPGKSYVIFRATGGKGYMLTGKGNAKEVTSYEAVIGGKVRWPNSGDAYSNVLWTYTGTPDKAVFESFGSVSNFLTIGKSTSGKRPVGSEKAYVKLETSSSPAIKVSNGSYYLALTSDLGKYTSSTSGNSLYFAEIDETIYNVKFNGANEELHIYEGALDKNYSVIAGDDLIVPGTDVIKKPEKYNYVLDSWVEINTGLVIKPGDTFIVDGDYEFYANWVPSTYDVGVNKDTVDSVDTNSFITTELFDYNDLFNLYSATRIDNRWSFLSYGSHSFAGNTSLGVVFFDNAKNSKAGLLNAIDNRDNNNASKQANNGSDYYDGIVTQGISSYAINDLFDKENDVFGVNYVGNGNYLYQYDEDTGFYYYDSRKNAAAYNKSNNRFYVYDYTYGTSKSKNEGEDGTDFLPFNYLSKKDASNDKSISSSNGATNYWFGLKSEINFTLIDDVGYVDKNGNYGNKDAKGNDMILKFSGDDDVWVFVDDKLALDLGGAHDIVYGEINFSTGVVTIAHNGALINKDDIGGMGYYESELKDGTKIIQTKLTGITAGNHKATFYYVERGANRSNVALYFNISDKFDQPGDIVISRDEESYASFEKHEFSFVLNDTSVNGNFGDVTFVNGVANFKLLGGEKIKISGLPAGINYSLKVFAPVKHTTLFNSNGSIYETREVYGRIVGGDTSNVLYKNNYDEYSDSNNDVVIPNTKDDITRFIIMLIISIFVCASSAVVYLKLSKKNKINYFDSEII